MKKKSTAMILLVLFVMTTMSCKKEQNMSPLHQGLAATGIADKLAGVQFLNVEGPYYNLIAVMDYNPKTETFNVIRQSSVASSMAHDGSSDSLLIYAPNNNVSTTAVFSKDGNSLVIDGELFAIGVSGSYSTVSQNTYDARTVTSLSQGKVIFLAQSSNTLTNVDYAGVNFIPQNFEYHNLNGATFSNSGAAFTIKSSSVSGTFPIINRGYSTPTIWINGVQYFIHCKPGRCGTCSCITMEFIPVGNTATSDPTITT